MTAVAERPAPPARRGVPLRSKAAGWALNAYASLALLYLFVPIFWIVAFSFNKPTGKFNIAWNEFTLDNWKHPFAEESLTDALWVSLRVALIATVVSTVLGTLIAMALARYQFKGSGLVNLLLILPLTSPEIVIGSSLATMFLDSGIMGVEVQFGYTTIIIAHIMFQVSFVSLTVRARIRGFDWTLEHAAQDLGATPWLTFRKVTFPLILPGILAGALLAFALSIDDFIITYFNAGSILTFPLQIYGASKVELPPQINVLATMILVVALALMGMGTFWKARRERA
ncbi:MAG TPA: ABC transporter permease [Acidimicrobiales bacterium]